MADAFTRQCLDAIIKVDQTKYPSANDYIFMSLFDALNPYASQSRSRNPVNQYPEVIQQPVIQTQAVQPTPYHAQYVPHRSELELAISEPPPVQLQQRHSAGPAQSPALLAVQELVRVVNATKEAQEAENQRRREWEQQQEQKMAQNQAALEARIFEMGRELVDLRSNFVAASPAPAVPVSPISLPAQPYNPMPSHGFHQYFPELQSSSSYSDIQPSPVSMTPSPSPQLQTLENVQAQSKSSRRKRKRRVESSEDEGSSSDSSDSIPSRPRRRNHHDKRCLTIHHAMRAHLLRLMAVKDDKHLPDSHIEGTPLESADPVRFVWDKTPKQSVHNSRMKTRVMEDLKAHRRRYKHVPEKEFGKKTLDSAFDQCFVTYRQKFKSQKDSQAAEHAKRREDMKALKVRRLARRKTKLNNRADARMNLPAFEHVTFDGAMQVDCMSSEESDGGDDNDTRQLTTHGSSWRSTRLIRFYQALDEEDARDKAAQPKRGTGKAQRIVGPPKDEFQLPPDGISSWMISRRWLARSQVTHPDLPDRLEQLVDDSHAFDWSRYHILGESSDIEPDPLPVRNVQHQMYASSSLQYALAS